jgi:Histidine kinase
MKSFAWQFWIRFFLIVGLGPAVGVTVGVSSGGKSIWLGLVFGALLAVISVAVAALWYRRVMRSRDPTFTYDAYALHAEATFALALPATAAYDLCLDALNSLPGFFAAEVSRETLSIAGLTGGGNAGYMSFGSPGEKLQVSIKPMTDNTSMATVRSQPGTVLVLLDFGKNKENIASVSRFINRELQRRFDEIAAQAARAETERALTLAKLNALQAQIEPHFLYNTLANAQSLTRSDPARADLMLGHLIQFLRSSLPTNDAATSTLGQEIDRLGAYLEIMKIRMGARLSYDVALDEKLRAQPFAPLMLQTLAENAIKHGIEPKTGAGKIIIRANIDADKLSVSVIDNGAGLSTATAGSGIGLKNIRERLHLTYGEAAKFLLTPNRHPDAGMTATITIPVDTIEKTI